MPTILERIQAIVSNELSVEVSDVVPEASFTEDLNADSLDLVNLIMAFEEQFGTEGEPLEISDEDAENITTVQRAIEYLEEHGISPDS